MSLEFKEGAFRVSVCRHGHVTLEVLDGEAVRFVAVMSRDEARDLGSRLVAVGLGFGAEVRVGSGRRRAGRDVH